MAIALLSVPWTSVPSLVVPALIIALVGFSEISAIARSVDASFPRRWDPDQEFLSQGVANLAAGLFGGFSRRGLVLSKRAEPLCQRHNRMEWSNHRCDRAGSLPLVGLLEALPQAVLGGIIVGAVARLMDPLPLMALRRYSSQQFLIAMTTVLLTLAMAPQIHWAVLVGIALAVGAHLRRERYLFTEHWIAGDELHLRPVGVVYFVSAQRLEGEARALLADHEGLIALVVDMDGVVRTDVTGAYALRSLLQDAAQRGLRLSVTALTPASRKIVSRVLAYSADLDGQVMDERDPKGP